MDKNFSQYITKELDCLPLNKKAKRLVSFCHFDAENKIANYVIYYLKSLQEANSDVVFVSNSNLPESEISKIESLCQKVIIRGNIGYDFAAYFTGFLNFRDNIKSYKQVLFVNDSVFGPFYPLSDVFSKMDAKNYDMWGISDAYHKHYHIQSYFWSFKTSDKVISILDEEAKNYQFELPKKHVVSQYEEGITRKFIDLNLSTSVLCSNAEAIDFEIHNEQDAELISLKKDQIRIAKAKQSFGRKIKSMFSVKAKREHNFKVPDANAYLTGINSCWYSMIKYFDCPFIKVSLLKGSGNFRYHGFKFISLLKDKYPQYDWTMIENHLKRVWK